MPAVYHTHTSQGARSQLAGYLLALGSAAAIATTFIVRKQVSTAVNPATFSVWWYGLAGIYERAALVDGQVTVDSAPNEGTTLIVRIGEPWED